MKRRLYTRPDGVDVIFHHDEMEKKNHIEYRQNVEPIIERNKARQTDGRNGYLTPHGTWKHIARVPTVVFYQWLKEDGIPAVDYMKRPRAYNGWLMRKLRSSDFRGLRVSETI